MRLLVLLAVFIAGSAQADDWSVKKDAPYCVATKQVSKAASISLFAKRDDPAIAFIVTDEALNLSPHKGTVDIELGSVRLRYYADYRAHGVGFLINQQFADDYTKAGFTRLSVEGIELGQYRADGIDAAIMAMTKCLAN